MKDKRGREINYIRISVTDRCNLRCIYCMPEQGVPCMSHKDILTFEEIERLLRILAKLGITRVKITGGEPLVRKNCNVLVDKIHRIAGIESVTMTTNGVLLPQYLDELVKAGLTAVNISLDAADSANYERITKRNHWTEAMAGIRAALKYPDLRVKINCVPIKGVNERDIIKIAELARENPIHVRFIEMMPIGPGKDFGYMGEEEVKKVLEDSFGMLSPVPDKLGNGPANYYQAPDFMGRIGFISARTHKFCGSCNRIRLTSDGFLKTCLQYDSGCGLKQALRDGTDDEEIKAMIEKTVSEKPACHHFENREGRGDRIEYRTMNDIGG